MCRQDGKPKMFQTRLLSYAKERAKELTLGTSETFRVYFCRHCEMYCLTSQVKGKSTNHHRKNQKKRKAQRRFYAMIESWENEGGAIQ